MRVAVVVVALLLLRGSAQLAPCDPLVCSYNNSEGHGSCGDDGVCTCDYAWSGPDCLFPSAAGRFGMWTFIAAVFGVTLPWFMCLAAAVELYLYLRNNWGQLRRSRLFPLFALVTLALCCFLRPFYYAIDPFAWRGSINVCGLWTIDYLTTALVACSFFLVLRGWAKVMLKFERLNGNRKPLMMLWSALPLYCAVCSVLLALFVVPSSVMACVCDDSNCSAMASDLVFYIPYLVLFGVGLFLSVIAAGVMVFQLWRFRRSAEHSARLFRYSLFVLLTAVAGLFLVAFGIVLLNRPANLSSAVFLAIEALNAVALDLLICGVLVVSYQGVRKPRKAAVAVDVSGGSGSSTYGSSLTEGLLDRRSPPRDVAPSAPAIMTGPEIDTSASELLEEISRAK